MGILSDDIEQITGNIKFRWVVEFFGNIHPVLRKPQTGGVPAVFWKNYIKGNLDDLPIDSFNEDVLKSILRRAILPNYFNRFELTRDEYGTWYFTRKLTEYGPRFGIALAPRLIK